MDSRDLWNNVKAELTRRGVKREHAARVMGISTQTYKRRDDDPDDVRLGEVVNLLNYFGIPMSELTRR